MGRAVSDCAFAGRRRRPSRAARRGAGRARRRARHAAEILHC